MQSNYRLLIVAFLSILAGFYLFQKFQTQPAPTSDTSNSALLEARFTDLDGVDQPLNQWQGKTIVLNFWATWCPPCREEMPELSEMQNQYKDQDLVIVGLSTDDVKTTKTYLKSAKVSYPILAGDMQAMSFAESLGNNQGILPYTVIINSKGKIVKTFFGRVNQTLLEKAVLPLLAIPVTSSKQ